MIERREYYEPETRTDPSYYEYYWVDEWGNTYDDDDIYIDECGDVYTKEEYAEGIAHDDYLEVIKENHPNLYSYAQKWLTENNETFENKKIYYFCEGKGKIIDVVDGFEIRDDEYFVECDDQNDLLEFIVDNL